MVTLINPPSRLHYLRSLRSPALLGCDSCKYGLRGRAALRGLGDDATFIPAGSQLNYQARYSAVSTSINPFNKAFGGDVNAVISSVQQNLVTQWKIQIVRSSYSAGGQLQYTVTFTLQTAADYGSIGDIKSIVDGAFYNAAGVRQVTSTISVASLAQPGANQVTQGIGPGDTPAPDDSGDGTPKPPGTDWTTIGLAIGLGAAGIFALKEIL